MRLGLGLGLTRPLGDVDAAVSTLIAAMPVKPDAARTALIYSLVRDLMLSGVWWKLALLYITASHDPLAALINWVTPGTYTLVPTNSPAFTVDRGIAGDGVASYYDTTFNIATSGTSWQRLTAHMGLYINTTPAGGSPQFGGVTSNSARSRIVNSGSTNLVQLNSSTATTFASTISGPQYMLATRDAANVSYGINGGAFTTIANSPLASLANTTFSIGVSSGSFSASRVSSAHVGGQLTQAESAALYAALRTYMVAIGADT